MKSDFLEILDQATIPTAETDLEAIANMLKGAAEYGLEAEVVEALYRIAKAQPEPNLNETIFEALCEWDL